jgi:hypothetical protein
VRLELDAARARVAQVPVEAKRLESLAMNSTCTTSPGTFKIQFLICFRLVAVVKRYTLSIFGYMAV